MDKILITGAAGYLGSMISTHFLEKGYRVTGVDNLFYNKNTLNHLIKNKNFEFIKLDVRDQRLYKDFVKKNDILFPLAGIVGAPLCDKNSKLAYEVNELAVKKISEFSSNNQLIIFPTTNSGYGTTSKDIICNEKMDLNPISLYGKTKVNAEKFILQKNNSISLRLATVFGVSFRNRVDLLVNFFVYNAVKFKKIKLFEPHFRRNYIHVKDVAFTFHHCLENFNQMRSNIYNVGLSEANLTKLQLCKKIKEVIPDFEISIDEKGEDPDKRDYFVSNEKLEMTNWKPKKSLKFGINELVKFYNLSKNLDLDKNYKL